MDVQHTAPQAGVSDRRTTERFACEGWVPIMFQAPNAGSLGAGHIVDVGVGGARIQAPPTTQTPVRLGDVLKVAISYSEAVREHSIEGLTLKAEIRAIHWDERGMSLHVHFDPGRNDWQAVLGFVRAMTAS